jgi:hypothetical protein
LTSLGDSERIESELYRLKAMAARDLNGEDARYLKSWLLTEQGLAVMKILYLREQAAMMAPCKIDLKTEEGVKDAIAAQSRAAGWTLAIDQFLEITEMFNADSQQVAVVGSGGSGDGW